MTEFGGGLSALRGEMVRKRGRSSGRGETFLGGDGAELSEGRFFLRRLREKLGFSQRDLCRRTGICRGRLRRLEETSFDAVTYGELRRISEALGIELHEMFESRDTLSNGPCLARAGTVAFGLDAEGAGYKITSFFPSSKDFFAGKLFVFSRKRVSPLEMSRAETVFLQTLLGTLHIEVGEAVYEVREGDMLVFRGNLLYAVENPYLRDAVALILTLPSFQP